MDWRICSRAAANCRPNRALKNLYLPPLFGLLPPYQAYSAIPDPSSPAFKPSKAQGARMRAFRFAIATIAAVVIAHISSGAMAEAVKQIQLSEKQVENYIAAQKDMSAIMQKLQASAGKPDPKVEGEIDATAKKYGFANAAEYDSVAENISLLMSCIDPKSKAFNEPKVALQKQIDEVKADKSIPDAQKKQILEDLNETLVTAEPIKYPSNIELVKKYYDKIDSAT
jgi:hypothetical protein